MPANLTTLSDVLARYYRLPDAEEFDAHVEQWKAKLAQQVYSPGLTGLAAWAPRASRPIDEPLPEPPKLEALTRYRD